MVTRTDLALQQLYEYAADHEAETDQRIVMAIRIIEGEPNAIAIAQKNMKTEQSLPPRTGQ